MNFLNLEFILSMTGIFFGTVAQLLVWIYMVACARRVTLPQYETFRANINLSFLFSMVILSFLCLTKREAAGPLSGLLMLVHLGLWALSALICVVLLIFCRNSRRELTSAMSACLFKLALTALALWVVA